RIPGGARTDLRSAATMASGSGVAFTLDCCDREAIAWVANHRRHRQRRYPRPDDREYRAALRIGTPPAAANRVVVGQRLALYRTRDPGAGPRDGLEPCTTPIESPQSNGMAEAFVKTLKRDYARVNPRRDAASVLRQLDGWFEHYNTIHVAR